MGKAPRSGETPVSEVATKVLRIGVSVMEQTMNDLADNFLGGMKDAIGDLPAEVGPKLQARLKKAAEYKINAMKAADQTTRDQYLQGVKDELARAKTILVSEAVVVSNEAAEVFLSGFGQVMESVAQVGKTLLSAVAAAAVQGLVSGVAGGEGFDPSGVFPGLN